MGDISEARDVLADRSQAGLPRRPEDGSPSSMAHQLRAKHDGKRALLEPGDARAKGRRGSSQYGGHGEVVPHQPGSLSPFKIDEIIGGGPDGLLQQRYVAQGQQQPPHAGLEFPGGAHEGMYRPRDQNRRSVATPTGISPVGPHPEALGRAVGTPADRASRPEALRQMNAGDLRELTGGRHPIVSIKQRRGQ